MAMKVKIERRKPKLEVSDYQWPAQSNALIMAWSLPAVVVLAIVGIAFMLNVLLVAAGVFAWYFLAMILLFKSVTAAERKAVQRGGLRNKVLPNSRPELKQMLTDHAQTLGITEPTAYVVEDDAGRIEAVNQNLIAISGPILKKLKPEEISAMLLEACVHIKLRQANLRAVARCWKDAGFLWWVCCLPAVIFPYLVDLNWVPCAELTADRLTLLYLRHPRVLTAAIIKLAVESGELANVDQDEVEEYLTHRSSLQVTSEDVHAHFKLGTALHQSPELNERVKGIIGFSSGPEFKALTTKMDESIK